MSRIKEKPYNVGATDIIEPTCYKPLRADGLELTIITVHFIQFILDTRRCRLIFQHCIGNPNGLSNFKSPSLSTF